MRKTKAAPSGMTEDVRIQEFLDMIAPSVIKFETDHFICGNTFRCVWALREYPTATDEQAILSHMGEKDGVTLRIYTRHVTPVEERKIISNAANKNRMERSNTNDLQQTVLAESNLQDVAAIVTQMHRNREPRLHTAVLAYVDRFELEQEIVRRRDDEEEDSWDDFTTGSGNPSHIGGQAHAAVPHPGERKGPVRRPPLRTD